MILLDTFSAEFNIGNFIITVVFGIICWLMNRTIQAHDKRQDDIDKHLEATDKALQAVKDLQSNNNLIFIEKMNKMEKEILAQLKDLSVKLEQNWRDNNKNS